MFIECFQKFDRNSTQNMINFLPGIRRYKIIFNKEWEDTMTQKNILKYKFANDKCVPE